jgi:hypothetical protein
MDSRCSAHKDSTTLTLYLDRSGWGGNIMSRAQAAHAASLTCVFCRNYYENRISQGFVPIKLPPIGDSDRD